MKRLQVGLLALFVLGAGNLWAQSTAPLKLIDTIAMPGYHEGDFDHFMVDLPGHRLFSAGEENGTVAVIDTRTDKVLHVISGLKSPHSMLLRHASDRLFVVDGDASEIKVYNATTYKLIKHIPMVIDADSITYDPATHDLYVVAGGRAAHTPYSFIEIVDTDTATVVGRIKVDTNRIEALQLEHHGPYLYANLTGIDAVGKFNRVTRKLVATWPTGNEGKVNVPLGFDEKDHRLFVVTRDPAKLVVLDSQTGKVITSLPCVSNADDETYDPVSRRIYVPGDNYIYVYQQHDADHYTLLGKVPGAPFRAMTGMVVPALNRYYLAVPLHDGHPAEVKVYAVVR